MDDKIVFEDNKQSNNDELLKENTPETIDYNKLYNINENSTNNSNIPGNNQYTNINEQKINNISNNINENNPTISNNISENNPTINNNEKKNEKSNMSSLLFIFLVFLIIMGVIIFLFPFIGKLLVN